MDEDEGRNFAVENLEYERKEPSEYPVGKKLDFYQVPNVLIEASFGKSFVVETAFQSFGSIPRLSRPAIVMEKLDGTNAQIYISENGQDIRAGSRNRWVVPGKATDNFGFAAWVEGNKSELLRLLGPGRHYGEWWGQGIARGYGLKERRFSLFNTTRWASDYNVMGFGSTAVRGSGQLLYAVPVLVYLEEFNTREVDFELDRLADQGSFAAPGFTNPEGVVVYHTASDALFKKTLDANDGHKGRK